MSYNRMSDPEFIAMCENVRKLMFEELGYSNVDENTAEEMFQLDFMTNPDKIGNATRKVVNHMELVTELMEEK